MQIIFISSAYFIRLPIAHENTVVYSGLNILALPWEVLYILLTKHDLCVNSLMMAMCVLRMLE